MNINEYNKAYNRDNYICQYCGKPANQIAHRISQSKMNYKKYGKLVIDNRNNLVSVCSLYCNSHFNIGNKPVVESNLIELIRSNIDKTLQIEIIDSIIY